MTNQKVKINKIIYTLFCIFFLISCSQQRQYNYLLLDDWENVEKSLHNQNYDSFIFSIEIFKSDFIDFQNTLEYEVLRHLDTDIQIYDKNRFYNETARNIIKSSEIILNSEFLSEEMTTAVYEIRDGLLEIQKTNHNNSLISIQYYFYILGTLIGIILIISTFLFIIMRRFEKESENLEELNIYSKIMIDGIEKERQRISKEIHDTVIQDIKVIQLENEAIDFAEDNEINQNHLNKIKTLTNNSIKQLRNLCNNLTPKEVKASIITALINLFHQFEEYTGITMNIKIQDDIYTGNLSTQQNLHIFRIIQEALANIENHAKAENVSVLIRNKEIIEQEKNKKYIMFFIIDDGIGFNIEESISNSMHFGLRNMEERAKLLNAKFDIISEAGEGAEITLEVPLNG